MISYLSGVNPRMNVKYSCIALNNYAKNWVPLAVEKNTECPSTGICVLGLGIILTLGLK